jgi:hypothetical protein
MGDWNSIALRRRWCPGTLITVTIAMKTPNVLNRLFSPIDLSDLSADCNRKLYGSRREELHRRVWTEPVRTVAKQLGISGQSVSKDMSAS